MGKLHAIGKVHIKNIKALEYLDEREKKEKEMLLKYMDKLPENWQVDLTLWRKEHGYHTLTEARAKKWALERK